MAERRMFAKSITNSARFLMMPVSSRLLYYDLGMAADDDGIVEAFTVMRLSGAAEDDLRVLHSRGFITILTDEFLAYINDWRVNNQVRPDRYHPSIHRDLLVQIQGMDTNGIPSGIPEVNQTTTNGNPSLVKSSLGKDSLGKDSLGECSLEEAETERETDGHTKGKCFVPPSLEEVAAYCREIQSTVDPAYFHDFYTSNGWKTGDRNIKNWKAVVRTWDKQDRKNGKTTLPENRPGYEPPQNPLDEITFD